MSTAYVECWKCDECGHRWIKGDALPSHCASSKCRKRSWNKNGGMAKCDSVVPLDHSVNAGVKSALANTNVGSNPAPATKPDMQALRDICAGNFSASVGANIVPRPEYGSVGGIGLASVEIPICGKTWWEDGSLFECLMDAGHCEALANKHGLRGMVRRLDD